MRIGYVGLGDMGGALARRLLLSRPLDVFDLNPAAMAGLTTLGATAADGLESLARDCDVIVLCLPKSAHVRAAIFGENGLAQGLTSGKILIDQTTGDPAETRAMAEELAAQGVTLIDAPVSGGPGGAEAGTIAIMVGASGPDYAQVLPILHDISPNVFHAGTTGAGHSIKLVNNLLSGAQRLLSMECLALAQKLGIDPADAVRILVAGGGRNVFLEKGVQPIIENGTFGAGFTLELMHKDIDLACRAGSEAGMPMYFGATAREMYRLSINLIGPGESVNAAASAIDRISGTRIVGGNRNE